MSALLIVDMQNDFISGGALAVKEGEKIIPLINEILKKKFDLIVASMDCHPEGHGSFASSHGLQVGALVDLNGIEQVLWPDHCIQGSYGAMVAPGLAEEKIDSFIYKGTHPDVDSYSAFYDNGKRYSTGLDKLLRDKGISKLYVLGLALDYCVKYSVLDALELGFETYLIRDACRGVDLQRGDCSKAVETMRERGAHIVESCELL